MKLLFNRGRGLTLQGEEGLAEVGRQNKGNIVYIGLMKYIHVKNMLDECEEELSAQS